MTTSALKRRSFLQGSLLAAAVIGSAPVAAAEAAKPKFDESFDVIVVGSGIAGTMAALSAADKGANVLMIDEPPRRYFPHQRSELRLRRLSRPKG